MVFIIENIPGYMAQKYTVYGELLQSKSEKKKIKRLFMLLYVGFCNKP